MLLYADEDLASAVVVELRRFNHDVITVQENGQRGADDLTILRTAHSLGRVLLTHNRRHLERLHRQGHLHSGIVSCTRDPDFVALAIRIDAAIANIAAGRWHLRVNRPS